MTGMRCTSCPREHDIQTVNGRVMSAGLTGRTGARDGGLLGLQLHTGARHEDRVQEPLV